MSCKYYAYKYYVLFTGKRFKEVQRLRKNLDKVIS